MGRLLWSLWGLVVGGGAWNGSPWIRTWRAHSPAGNPNTHLSWAKASVIRNAVGDGCWCGKTAPWSLGLSWVDPLELKLVHVSVCSKVWLRGRFLV